MLLEPKNVCRCIFRTKHMETRTNVWNILGIRQSSVILILVQTCEQLLKICTPIRDIPQFSKARVLRKYKLNSLRLARKYAWIFVNGHNLFREANTFPRALFEKNCEVRGTDNVQGYCVPLWRSSPFILHWIPGGRHHRSLLSPWRMGGIPDGKWILMKVLLLFFFFRLLFQSLIILSLLA